MGLRTVLGLAAVVALVAFGVIDNHRVAKERRLRSDGRECEALMREEIRRMQADLKDDPGVKPSSSRICRGCLDRNGTVYAAPLTVRRVEYDDYDYVYDFAVYYDGGGVHPSTSGGYVVTIGLVSDEASSPNSWRILSERIDAYWDWFDRFERGEADLYELNAMTKVGWVDAR